MRGVGFRTRHAVVQKTQHAQARGRHPLRRRTREPHANPLAARADVAHAHGHAHYHAARAEGVVGDPVDEIAQGLAQRRDVELVFDLFEAIVQARPRMAFAPDHTGIFGLTERNVHEIAGCKRHAGRHAIGIGLVEGQRHQDVHDFRGFRGFRHVGRFARFHALKEE